MGPDARVLSWQQTNAQVFAALNIQRNVMVVILALIILVAAFNIISSLVMLVKDKGADIAVLRFNTRGTKSPRGTSEGQFSQGVDERRSLAVSRVLANPPGHSPARRTGQIRPGAIQVRWSQSSSSVRARIAAR